MYRSLHHILQLGLLHACPPATSVTVAARLLISRVVEQRAMDDHGDVLGEIERCGDDDHG